MRGKFYKVREPFKFTSHCQPPGSLAQVNIYHSLCNTHSNPVSSRLQMRKLRGSGNNLQTNGKAQMLPRLVTYCLPTFKILKLKIRFLQRQLGKLIPVQQPCSLTRFMIFPQIFRPSIVRVAIHYMLYKNILKSLGVCDPFFKILT